MYGFKIFIFLWVLVGAIFCLYALSTDKIKVLVNDRPLLETAISITLAPSSAEYYVHRKDST